MTYDFDAEMWEPFASWVATTHRKDAAAMYAHWPRQHDSPALTDRALELWAKHTRDYVNETK